MLHKTVATTTTLKAISHKNQWLEKTLDLLRSLPPEPIILDFIEIIGETHSLRTTSCWKNLSVGFRLATIHQARLTPCAVARFVQSHTVMASTLGHNLF